MKTQFKKITLIAWIALVFAVASVIATTYPAFADPDADPATGVNTPGKAKKTYNHVSINAPSKEHVPVEIQGMCSIVPSDSNPVAGPCVNIVVAMNHEDGSEYVKNRTTPQGKFSFEAEAGEKYQLALGSKLYEIVAPTGFIQAGQRVDLRIRQK